MYKTLNTTALTLVELLVILAILSILSILIFPVILSAREHAQQIKCASNLKQIITGWMTYSSDNNGKVAPCWVDDDPELGGKTVIWVSLMQDYLGDAKVKQQPKNTTWQSVRISPGGVLMCPSLQDKMVPQYLTNSSAGLAHYGMNAWVTMPSQGGWNRIVNIPRPSETIVFTDSITHTLADSQATGWYVAGPSWGQIYIDTRHRGGANAAFADGHVQWVSKEDLTVVGVKPPWRYSQP